MADQAIAVVTSGGDAPGMNAAVVTIVKAAEKAGEAGEAGKRIFPNWKGKGKIPVLGVRNGYRGLCEKGNFMSLTSHSVAGCSRRSGTILGSARYPELKRPEEFRDWAEKSLAIFKHMCIRALIVLGGDGSLRAAKKLYEFSHRLGDFKNDKENRHLIQVVGIPCSVDNDIPRTDYSIGCDTGVNSTMELMDNLVGTAYSHRRVFLMETMGARSGYLALMAALTGEAERVYLPENETEAGWRYTLFDDFLDHLKPFVVDSDDPVHPRKTQATVVFAEEFDRREDRESDSGHDLKIKTGIQYDILEKQFNEYCVKMNEKDEKDDERIKKLPNLREPARTEEFLNLWHKYGYPVGKKDTQREDVEFRSSVPGHVVRGEVPTARDRILACRLALRAVKCIVNCWSYEAATSKKRRSHPKSEKEIERQADVKCMEKGHGVMIGICGDTVRPVSLAHVIRLRDRLGGKMNWRSEFFFRQPRELVRTLGKLSRHPSEEDDEKVKKRLENSLDVKVHCRIIKPEKRRRLAVMTVGADAPGMNAAIRAVVRTAIDKRIEPLGIRDGFVGLDNAGETEHPCKLSPEELDLMGLDYWTLNTLLRVIKEEYLKIVAEVEEDGRDERTDEIVGIMRRIKDITKVSGEIGPKQVVPWAVREAAYIFPFDWMRVNNIGKLPGSILNSMRSTREYTGEDWRHMGKKLEKLGVDGLIVIGGMRELQRTNDFLKILKEGKIGIPIIGIPATVDNDIPGTHFSIGADTALNTICEAADRVMATAAAAYRVFVIEVMGRICGYLPFMGAIAGAAEAVLIPERPFTLKQLNDLAEHIREGFQRRRRHGVVICGEEASKRIGPVVVRDAIEDAGRGFFEARFVRLGHLQRGGVPTAFDRELGSRMGFKAAEVIEEMMDKGTNEFRVIVIQPADESFKVPKFINWEGWDILAKSFDEDILVEVEKNVSETNKRWWDRDQYSVLQKIMMVSPYYDGIETILED